MYPLLYTDGTRLRKLGVSYNAIAKRAGCSEKWARELIAAQMKAAQRIRDYFEQCDTEQLILKQKEDYPSAD